MESDTGTVKRGRGRPRKEVDPDAIPAEKRSRGRPRTRPLPDPNAEKKGRGRPAGSKNKPKEKKPGRKKGQKSSYTVSEKALAQRQLNVLHHTTTKVAVTEEGKAYNARLIEHIMRVNEIATHADRNDLLSLKSCFIAYLQLCQEDGFSVSNLSAYASMGFPSHSHFEMFAKKDDPERRAFCAFVKQTCSMFRESMVSDSKVNPVIGIFWQRNFDGLRNDTEQVQNAQENEDDFAVAKSYKEKYKNLIGG